MKVVGRRYWIPNRTPATMAAAEGTRQQREGHGYKSGTTCSFAPVSMARSAPAVGR
jgi:hypothetical protein